MLKGKSDLKVLVLVTGFVQDKPLRQGSKSFRNSLGPTYLVGNNFILFVSSSQGFLQEFCPGDIIRFNSDNT